MASKRKGQAFRGGFKFGEEFFECGLALMKCGQSTMKLMNRAGGAGDPSVWSPEQQATYDAYLENLKEELADVEAIIKHFKALNHIKTDASRIREKIKKYRSMDLPGVYVGNTESRVGMTAPLPVPKTDKPKQQRKRRTKKDDKK